MCEAQARKGAGASEQATMSKRSSAEKQALKLREGHRRKRASAQAMVRKLPDRGAWTKYHVSLIVGLDYDPSMFRMFHVERNLVW